MFPFTKPVIFLNEGKGYIDIYSHEPEDIYSRDTMLAKLVALIEPRAEVGEAKGTSGLRRARVRVNYYRKAVEDGIIAPTRELVPPYLAPPQLYKSNVMPGRRIKNTLMRIEDEMARMNPKPPAGDNPA